MRFLPRYVLAVSVLLLIGSLASARPFLKDPAQLSSDELNAVALLASEAKDVYFDEESVVEIAQEISQIKTRFAEVAMINDFGAETFPFTMAVAGLKDSEAKSFLDEIERAAAISQPVEKYFGGQVDVTSQSLAYADFRVMTSLIPGYKVVAHYSVGPNNPFTVSYLVIKLPFMTNILNLVNRIGPLTILEYIEPNALGGDGNRIVRKVVSTERVEYAFAVGEGDCSVGCTEWTTHRFTYNAKGGEIVKTGVDNIEPY